MSFSVPYLKKWSEYRSERFLIIDQRILIKWLNSSIVGSLSW